MEKIESRGAVISESEKAASKNKKISGLRYNRAFNYVSLALLGICTGLLSLLLGAASFGLPLFWKYFSVPLVMLLNLLPIVLVIFLLYFITGRAWIAYTFPSFFALSLSVIGFLKIQVRGDPFVAFDMVLVSEANNIAAFYRFSINWKIYFVAGVFICFVVFSALALRHVEKKRSVRLIGSGGAAVVIALLYFFVYDSTEIYDKTKGAFDENPWSFSEKYISKGFMYPFIHSINYVLPDIPDGYSRAEARRLTNEYEDGVIPDGRKVNLICLALESYADLSEFDVLEFEADVYGPLHRLQDRSVSGTLVNNIFGGGTIDTERLFLTGFTALTNYDAATNSYVHYLRSQGYRTEGFHAGDGWFYGRDTINEYLGFDDYYFLENFENSTRWDDFFFPKVTELYEARDKLRPYFNFSLSYQNHGGYEEGWTEEPYLIARNGMSDGAFNILNNYFTGIYDTTLRIESFVDSLQYDPEPVVVVIFGDHMPWLGNLEWVYEELGITVDTRTEDGFYNYYSSPYLIWANEAAKETLGNDFTGDGGSFSPCFLMGEVFRLCSWDGDSHMQALRELKLYTDVISTPSGLFREDGGLTLQLSDEAWAAYNRFRITEHYRLNNFFFQWGD